MTEETTVEVTAQRTWEALQKLNPATRKEALELIRQIAATVTARANKKNGEGARP